MVNGSLSPLSSIANGNGRHPGLAVIARERRELNLAPAVWNVECYPSPCIIAVPGHDALDPGVGDIRGRVPFPVDEPRLAVHSDLVANDRE